MMRFLSVAGLQPSSANDQLYSQWEISHPQPLAQHQVAMAVAVSYRSHNRCKPRRLESAFNPQST